MILSIGLGMVKTYFKLYLGRNHSKCLSYSGECHIYIFAKCIGRIGLKTSTIVKMFSFKSPKIFKVHTISGIQDFSKSGVPPNSGLFGGTVPPNNFPQIKNQ